MEAILTRRSCRKFLPEAVDTAVVDRIVRAGMQAPSAHNKQPWELIVITNADMRLKMSQMTQYTKPAATAPVHILVCADHERAIQVPPIPYYAHDLGACCENMLLQATSEGLGSLWMGFEHEHVNEQVHALLDMPSHVKTFALIAIGHAEKPSFFVDRFNESRVHYEKW